MKQPAFDSDPLPNPRHEAFAQTVASGNNATEAYLKVYGTKNRPAAATGGNRLLRRKPIAARIQALQQSCANDVAMGLREIHDFLARVVRTPAGQVTPASDLCARVKHARDGVIDVWMPDKLACLRVSAKLQGFLDPAHLANLALKSAQAASPPIDGPRVMTEERWEFLVTQKHEAKMRRLKREEEGRVLREQALAQKKQHAEDRRIFDEERRQGNPSAQPGPRVPHPAPSGPQPPAWIGPSGRYPYFGQNFRKQPPPAPTPPIVPPPAPPPPSAQPETRNETRHDEAERRRQPETRGPAPSRVTPDESLKIANNSHHPTETTSPGTPEPNSTHPVPAVAGVANQQPDIRDRLCREASFRLRIIGDSSTSDALLVL